MIFKCYLCKSYKFWNKNCYEMIATDSDGNEKFSRKICEPCGTQVDEVYEGGQKEAEIADWVKEDQDDGEE